MQVGGNVEHDVAPGVGHACELSGGYDVQNYEAGDGFETGGGAGWVHICKKLRDLLYKLTVVLQRLCTNFTYLPV